MNEQESWMNRKWRPAMGWTYMAICILDFALFPILWSVLQAYAEGQVTSQLDPLTLKGAGLFHMAMGAILGIAVYGRTKEKLEGANNGGIQLPSNVGTTYIPPSSTGQQSGGNFGAPVATTVTQTYGQPQPMGGGFGGGSSFASSNSFSGGMQAATFTSRSGKPGPVQDFPEL